MRTARGGEQGFPRLKRAVMLGDAAIFGWLGFLGGYMSLKQGDSFGWFAIAVGVAVLVLPFTAFLRNQLDSLASHGWFPALVILPNMALILMFGSIASSYLKDPFLAYNDLDTLAAFVFSGATTIAIAALIANGVALYLDLRSGPSRAV